MRKKLRFSKLTSSNIICSRAFHFKHNFMTKLRFKNFLITDEFIKIDAKRKELDMEAVLPLTKAEQNKYVQLTSFHLVKLEIRFLIDKSLFLMMSTLHVCGLLFADYSLYWFLSMIHFFGSQENVIERERKLKSITSFCF